MRGLFGIIDPLNYIFFKSPEYKEIDGIVSVMVQRELIQNGHQFKFLCGKNFFLNLIELIFYWPYCML